MPAVAMPGLPVEFIHVLPSAHAVTVGAPLSKSVTPHSCANCCAVPIRAASIAAIGFPIKRAISPGCGVRTVLVFERARGTGPRATVPLA